MKKNRKILFQRKIAKERIEILKKRILETDDPLLKKRYEELIKRIAKMYKIKDL